MTPSTIIQVDHLSKHYKVPVAFAVTVPAQALTNRLTALTLPGALGLTILLVLLSRFIWRLGVRGYSGASA
jgi:ABC-2 type transport system permease protein